MITVISPAKTLDFESTVPDFSLSEPVFQEKGNSIASKLSRFSVKKIQDLMKLSDDLAQLNTERYREWKTVPTDKEVRAALYAFKGDVYLGLDGYSLSEEQVNYAQNHLRILSGLYGVLKPLDGIQPYRLEMGTSLPVQRSKNLYQYWSKSVIDLINSELKEQSTTTLVNLASNEYFKVIDKKKLEGTVVTPVFKDLKNGNYKVISFFAKKARGMMSRFIIENKIEKVEDLLAFEVDGYHFNANLSTESEPVFTRELE